MRVRTLAGVASAFLLRSALLSYAFRVAQAPQTGGGGGVSDHGALTGLADDDHPQYETTAEVAAQIGTHNADTTAVHGIADTSLLATDAELAAMLDQAVILAPASSARNVIQPTAGTVIAAIVKAHAAQSVDLMQWQLSSGALAWGLSKGGHEILADLAAPADGDVPTGQRWQWYDDSVGAPVLKFTQRDSAGTLFKGRALSSDYDTGAVRIAVVDGVAAIDYVLQLEIPDRDIITGNGYGPYFTANGEQLWGIDAWGAMYLSGPFVSLEIAKVAGDSSTKILQLVESGLAFYGADADTTVLFSTSTVIDGIGFFNASQVVQQTAASVGDLWTALKNYGLLDVGSSAPDMATQAELDGHVNDASDAHDASAVSFSPTGTIASTDVQAAIAEVASEAGGGGISPTLFDANTVLAADTDDTPAALTMGASTILARLAAGNIKAATPDELRTLLALVVGTDVQAFDSDLAAIAALADPNADRILFWDDSAGAYTFLTPGTGLTITGTTIDAAGGGGGFPRNYVTGAYYQTNQDPNADSTLTPVLDRVIFHAFPVGQALTIDRITCGVSTAGTAGSVVRLGVYNDSDGKPGTLLLDAGTVAGDSTGYKEITVSQALSAGTMYWIAVVWQVAAVGILRASGVASGSSWMAHASTSSDPRTSAWSQVSVSGALPSPATPVNTVGLAQAPAVKVRAT